MLHLKEFDNSNITMSITIIVTVCVYMYQSKQHTRNLFALEISMLSVSLSEQITALFIWE